MYSYKGSISFGLVYIPITLHVSIRTNDIGFNLIDRETKQRVRYVKMVDDKEVEMKDLVKGYEYEEDKYVIFEDEDFEKLKSKKDKNITIMNFIDIKDIDPIYYEKTYYVVPTGAEKAFQVLLKAMEDEKKVGIAKTVIGNKESLIVVRSKNEQMILSTLYFHDEVKKNPANKIEGKVKVEELKLAKSIIASMSTKFDPKDYKDEYREKVISAIEQKITGKKIVKPREKNNGNIVNLMDALKSSLDELTPKKKNIPKNNDTRGNLNA